MKKLHTQNAAKAPKMKITLEWKWKSGMPLIKVHELMQVNGTYVRKTIELEDVPPKTIFSHGYDPKREAVAQLNDPRIK